MILDRRLLGIVAVALAVAIIGTLAAAMYGPWAVLLVPVAFLLGALYARL